MNNHAETVGKIYEAFGKGDIPAILEHIAEDVRWEAWENNYAQNADVPWLQPGTGKHRVMNFFKIVGEMKFNEFTIKSIMPGPDQVAVELVLEAVLPGTGVVLRDEEIHLWTFNAEGKVIRMRHYADTAKHIQAAEA